MNLFNNITTGNNQIYSYNKKTNLSQNSEKSNNKKEENKMPLTQRIRTPHFFIDDSLTTLKECIQSKKPYIISSSIRKKMKNIKIAKNKELGKFHSLSIKSSTIRKTLDNFTLNNMKKESPSIILKNRNHLKLDSEENFKNDNKTYRINKYTHKKNANKYNFSKKNYSNSSNIKTNYSSNHSNDVKIGNYIGNSKYSYDIDICRSDDNDLIGYKNFYVKEPLYGEQGVIKNFLNKVHDLRKDSYKNYYLKLNQFKTNILYENKLTQIYFNERKHSLTKYYLDKYNNGFNIYWYKLNTEIKRETENLDDLEYKIKEVKIQINKLSDKILKILIKIMKIMNIREFFEELKNFCSFKLGTPHYILLDSKNQIMKKVKEDEAQTNYYNLLLSNKDLGIYSFMQKNQALFNNKDIKEIIYSYINKDKDIPEILNLNIKDLLMKEHFLEKEIDSLKYKLSELLEESKFNNNYEKKILIEVNLAIKKLAFKKTEKEYLEYKYEKLRKKIKNDGGLNKNYRIKILKIIKILNNNKYITEEENTQLKEIYTKNEFQYFLKCLEIIENKINFFNKFKAEIINPNEKFLQLYKTNCNIDDAIRKKIKENQEKFIKKQNVINKLNKARYNFEMRKDFFNVNRVKYLKMIEKEEKKRKKEIERLKNKENSSIKAIMTII